MTDVIKEMLLQLKCTTYERFRVLDILKRYNYDHPESVMSFTDDEIDNFRSLVSLVVMCETHPRYKSIIYDNQFIQLLAEYACWGFDRKNSPLPEDFHIHGNFMHGSNGSYSRIYHLLNIISKNEVPIGIVGAMLPYLVVSFKPNYKLEKKDVRILERIAYSIMTKTYVRGSKRVDINCDFMNIRYEFTHLINLVFKDTDKESEYVVNRIICLFKEIAMLWCICILTRTKTHNKDIDSAVSVLLTRKLTEYRTIVNTI